MRILTIHCTPNEARNYWGWAYPNRCTDKFTYDASYVKLRQLVLGYSFPLRMISKTPFTKSNIVISQEGIFGFIHKNTPNIDPESTYTNSNSQGLDYFAMPAVRSWGFNLRMEF